MVLLATLGGAHRALGLTVADGVEDAHLGGSNVKSTEMMLIISPEVVVKPILRRGEHAAAGVVHTPGRKQLPRIPANMRVGADSSPYVRPASGVDVAKCGSIPKSAFAGPHSPDHTFVGEHGFSARLTKEMLERALRPFRPHRAELNAFVCKLMSGEPTRTIVFGGSISVGHHLGHQERDRYSAQLERWLRATFPIAPHHVGKKGAEHRVINKALSSTGSCFLAKSVRQAIVNAMHADEGDHKSPDLIIVEYGVNDADPTTMQTRDFLKGLDVMNVKETEAERWDKIWRKIYPCVEWNIQHMREAYPHTAIVYLEMKTQQSSWATAQESHQEITQSHGVPMISFRDALITELYGELPGTPSSNAEPLGSILCHGGKAKEFPFIACKGPGPCSVLLPGIGGGGDGEAVECPISEEGEPLPGGCPNHPEKCYSTVWPADGVHPSKFGHYLVVDLFAAAIRDVVAHGGKSPGPEDNQWVYHPKSKNVELGATASWRKAVGSTKKGTRAYKPVAPHKWTTEQRKRVQALRNIIVDLATAGLPSIPNARRAGASLWSTPTDASGSAVTPPWGAKCETFLLSTVGPIPPKNGLLKFAIRTTGGGKWKMKRCHEVLPSDCALKGLWLPQFGDPFSESFKPVPCEETGFTFASDRRGKEGWIAMSRGGGAVLAFDIEVDVARGVLPFHSGKPPGYAVTLGFMRSYAGQGSFTVQCTSPSLTLPLNTRTWQSKTKVVDLQWSKHISVYDDEIICNPPSGVSAFAVTITTLPQKKERSGNKVKILSLSITKVP
jgi:lysophospholipase L1-like esterase